MQTFEAKVANVCGKKMEKTGTEIVGPILDTRKGRKDSPFGSLQPSLPQEISAESVLCYRKESAWEAFVDGLDVAEQFITSQSSLGTGNEIWWQFFPLVP